MSRSSPIVLLYAPSSGYSLHAGVRCRHPPGPQQPVPPPVPNAAPSDPPRVPNARVEPVRRLRARHHGPHRPQRRRQARFPARQPVPATGKTTGACPGYQIDHRVPLGKGGADDPANMEWLTTEQHKAKTAAESR